MTPLLSELATRGHDVRVRTLPSQAEQLVDLDIKVDGIDFKIREVVHPDWGAANSREALQLAVRQFCARAELDGPDLAAAIEAVGPDVLIVDINAWGAQCTADASGIPWVTFSPYTPPLRSKGAPPFGPGLKPIPGPIGRVRDAMLRPLVQGVAERTMRPGINKLRLGMGLDPVESADDFFRRADLLVITTAEPFEYPHPDWGDDILLIGASAWEPPQEQPAWLNEIDRPIVLVTTSSEYQDDSRLVGTALEALADEPVAVIATMPAGVSDGFEVPANARVEQYVLHGPVLDRAALAITHGGMGATQKALSRGVPVCVVPFGRDQLEVARRVEVSGAGTRLPVKKLTPKRLLAAVREAMTRRDGAAAVAEGYVRAGGATTAADAVENRLIDAANMPA